MLNIAVCDDDLIFASMIENILLEISETRFIEVCVEVYSDGQELWRAISSGKTYQILYLDIEMVCMNGIDVAKKIREIDRETIIIYISNYDNYLMDLFEVEPFRFLRKPIDKELFLDYFKKAYEKIIDEDAYFEYKFNKISYKVLMKNIMYFESNGRVIKIHCEDWEGKFYGKLKRIEEELARGRITFLRIHQSYLVNYNYIREMGFSKIVLLNGVCLQVSEERKKIIRTKCMDLMSGEFLDG